MAAHPVGHRRKGAVGRTLARLSLSAVAVVATVAAPPSPPAKAFHALDFHWGPARMTISNLAGSAWSDAARWAGGAWDVADWPSIAVTAGDHDCDDPPVGVVTVCYAGDHTTTHIHVILGRDEHARKGVIHIAPSDAHDSLTRKRGTLCQEVGHALGLDHRADGSGCMRSANYPSPDRQDHAELAAIYDHRAGYRHWHNGRWHKHRFRHCHFSVIFCLSSHRHTKRHWHGPDWHWHES